MAKPQITFSLHWYDGPADINGVQFTSVHVSEHADSEGSVILKGWEGTARVAKSDVPTVTPAWVESTMRQLVRVHLPENGTGQAFITGAALIDNRRWEIDFAGVGPSPWAQDA